MESISRMFLFFLMFLCCPFCEGELTFERASENGDESEFGPFCPVTATGILLWRAFQSSRKARSARSEDGPANHGR